MKTRYFCWAFYFLVFAVLNSSIALLEHTPYDILELKLSENYEAAKKSHRKLALKYHPDKNPKCTNCKEKLQEINDAYDHITRLQGLKSQILSGEIPKTFVSTRLFDLITAARKHAWAPSSEEAKNSIVIALDNYLSKDARDDVFRDISTLAFVMIAAMLNNQIFNNIYTKAFLFLFLLSSIIGGLLLTYYLFLKPVYYILRWIFWLAWAPFRLLWWLAVRLCSKFSRPTNTMTMTNSSSSISSTEGSQSRSPASAKSKHKVK